MDQRTRKVRRSAAYARNRIRILLLSERISCTPHTMRLLRQDFIHTVKKYASIDESHVRVYISNDPPVLHAELPLRQEKEAPSAAYRKGKNKRHDQTV